MLTTNQNVMTNSKLRNTYIDTARGIGILLLILGHIVTANSYLFNWIYSFHMPLFFFLSGMVVNEKNFCNFPTYIKKKNKARLLPYFVITFLGIIICMIIPQYRKDAIALGLTAHIVNIFLYLRPAWLYIGQVWFLPALFWSEIYFYGFYKLVGKKHIFIQLATSLIFVVGARYIWYLDPYIPITRRVPFLLDVAFMGTFCYILGFFAKKLCIFERINKWWSLPLIPILLVINIYFGTYLNGYVNMCDLVFVDAFRYITAMIAGVGFILLLSLFIQKIRFLQWLGRYSLPLFASHTFIIYLVREIVYHITGTYYTMMADVPNKLAVLMTIGVLIFLIPIGLLYSFLQSQLKKLSLLKKQA
ncbi:MAG: hypothetical protein E7261_01095 [Lachnospiraceae bacterium]|nr:hypothetical protein [Lachnospiraceae bacterium]